VGVLGQETFIGFLFLYELFSIKIVQAAKWTSQSINKLNIENLSTFIQLIYRHHLPIPDFDVEDVLPHAG
jgi:hypothetical protein